MQMVCEGGPLDVAEGRKRSIQSVGRVESGRQRLNANFLSSESLGSRTGREVDASRAGQKTVHAVVDTGWWRHGGMCVAPIIGTVLEV